MAGPERNHILNCGYGRGFSVLEVLDAVDRVTNMKIERRMESSRAGDTDSLISDNRAIMQRFTWEPQYADLDQIVTDALTRERQLRAIRANALLWLSFPLFGGIQFSHNTKIFETFQIGRHAGR